MPSHAFEDTVELARSVTSPRSGKRVRKRGAVESFSESRVEFRNVFKSHQAAQQDAFQHTNKTELLKQLTMLLSAK